MRSRLLRSIASRTTGCWKKQCSPACIKPCWFHRYQRLDDGIDIFGYFLSEVGLGESARLYYHAASQAGIDVNAVDLPLDGRTNLRGFRDVVSQAPRCRIGLTVQGLPGFRRTRAKLCRQRYNVALPYWELEAVPKQGIEELLSYDAIWAPSTFIKNTLDAALGRETILVRQPVAVPKEVEIPKNFHGPLRILFFFDFDSYIMRKNPHGAVQAFKRAFPKREDVSLSIKVRGANDKGGRAWLREQAARDARITIIDEIFSEAEMNTLMRHCDVFLSLHRSEGFGFGCAQALALGKIVVSTDYGGVTDFVSERTGFPIKWRRVPVKRGAYIDAPDSSWAEPDLDQAADVLRQIYDAPHEARRRAAAGIEHLLAHHAPSIVGASMRATLLDPLSS